VNSRIPITILEVRPQKEATNAGVRQDKETPQRFNTASDQPSNVQGVAFQHETDENPPALQRPKHHGSQKRQVVPVAGCVPPFIADQIERMRDQGGKQKLSRSAVVANLIIRGVQHNVDMQYGATLEPVIEKSITRNIQSYSNRNANINWQTLYAAEQNRLLSIHILRFLTDLMDASEELVPIITACQQNAWDNLKKMTSDMPAAPPQREETNREWQS
jgi:hypothetical protein